MEIAIQEQSLLKTVESNLQDLYTQFQGVLKRLRDGDFFQHYFAEDTSKSGGKDGGFGDKTHTKDKTGGKGNDPTKDHIKTATKPGT